MGYCPRHSSDPCLPGPQKRMRSQEQRAKKTDEPRVGDGCGTRCIPEQHSMTTEASIGRKIGRKGMALRCWIPLSILGCAFLFLIITMYRRAGPYDEALILVG